MTDVLRETLEERGRATPWEDVDALVAAGDRRVRRRRVAAGAAAVAVLAAVGVATPYVVSSLGGGADRGQIAVDDPAASAPVSWSEGTVVHVGERELDLGGFIVAYVLTEHGVVWVGPGGVVSFTGLESIDSSRIGTTRTEATRLLVAEGSAAAWYDPTAEELVVFDSGLGQVVHRVPAPVDAGGDRLLNTPRVRALADGVLWFSEGTAASGVDVASGNVLDSVGIRDTAQPLDARAGHLVLNSSEASDSIVRISDGEEVGSVPGGGQAILSPDAATVITETEDTNKVFDVSTGKDVTPDHGYDFIFGVQWLDEDTFEALGLSDRESSEGEDAPVGDVITCSVSDSDCEVVAESVLTAGDDEAFSVPIGELTGD